MEVAAFEYDLDLVFVEDPNRMSIKKCEQLFLRFIDLCIPRPFLEMIGPDIKKVVHGKRVYQRWLGITA